MQFANLALLIANLEFSGLHCCLLVKVPAVIFTRQLDYNNTLIFQCQLHFSIFFEKILKILFFPNPFKE